MSANPITIMNTFLCNGKMMVSFFRRNGYRHYVLSDHGGMRLSTTLTIAGYKIRAGPYGGYFVFPQAATR